MSQSLAKEVRDIYFAAQYPRREELSGYRYDVEQYGFNVTSNWLEEKAPLTSQMGDHTEEFYLETATIDLEDIDRADSIAFFAEPIGHIGIVRGGRHVEFGYALAKDKTIFVIGDKENVFHYIPGVTHFKNFNEFLDFLKHLPKGE